MKCPIDSTTLAITERQGIEVDYCPECRGVWLDRGELDKLISLNDRNLSASHFDPKLDQRQRQANDHYTSRHANPKRKKESFLSELFDFGD